ncbi:hypothetical protein [Microcella sp.]|uniref:hypothetical protein n=1 Tax=Microcella sp. TaxID=1913979 RepID=UPI00391905D9
MAGLISEARHYLRPVRRAVRNAWARERGPIATEWQLLRASRRPTTFREALAYKMARDRRLLLVMYADKLAARSFVAERVGAHWLTTLYGHGRRADDVPWDSVPREFVAKVNHGSGGVIVVSERAPIEKRLPAPSRPVRWSRHFVHPDSVDPVHLRSLLDRWRAMPFAQEFGDEFEWAYGLIVPRVFAEQLLTGANGLPQQVRFWCVKGAIVSAAVESVSPRNFGPARRMRLLASELDVGRRELGIAPDLWRDLVDASVTLASDADFVRVDWLVDDGRPYFSELTNYPMAGRIGFGDGVTATPEEFSRIHLAAWLPRPNYRRLDRLTRDMARRVLDAEPV